MQDYTGSCWTKAPDRVGNLGLVHVMDALWSEGGQKKLISNLEEELAKLSAARGLDGDGDGDGGKKDG